MPVNSVDGMQLPGRSAGIGLDRLSKLYWARRAEGWRGAACQLHPAGGWGTRIVPKSFATRMRKFKRKGTNQCMHRQSSPLARGRDRLRYLCTLSVRKAHAAEFSFNTETISRPSIR